MSDTNLSSDHILALNFIDQCDSLFAYAYEKEDINVCVGLAKSALAIAITATVNYGIKKADALAVIWYYRLLYLQEDGADDTSKTINWAKPLMDRMSSGSYSQSTRLTVRRSASMISRWRVEAGAQTKIDCTLKSRRTRYQIKAAAVALGVALVAGICADKWPIRGHHVQAGFFLSLTSSLITLLGIVFTLFLIGSQLTATRTNISLRRIFGVMAWLYLILFITTTLWTLAISYRAANFDDPIRVCPALFGMRTGCISEIFAGRLAIFGLVASLVLLPFFISYVYRRLTPSYIFSNLATAVLRAGSAQRLKSRSEQLGREITSALPDSHAATEGVEYLLELGALSALKRQRGRGPSPYDRAAQVTNLLRDLAAQSDSTRLRASAIEALETWCKWLVSHVRIADTYPPDCHALEGREVAELVRRVRDYGQKELVNWRNGENSEDVAKRSINLLNAIAKTCKPYPLHIYMTAVARDMGSCAVRKSVDGSVEDFNLALRGLIALCRICILPSSRHLNGIGVIKRLTSTIESLGAANDSRKPIPHWTIAELHNLTDGMSLQEGFDAEVWRSYIKSLASLNRREISGIVTTPADPKDHRFKGTSHSSWQNIIFQTLDATGRSDVRTKIFDDAARSWIKDKDLGGLTSEFGKLVNYYRQGRGGDTIFLLVAITAYVRHCYQGMGAGNESTPS